MVTRFPPPLADKQEQEEGDRLAPRFDSDGLVTAITVDAADNAVLMLAHMNAEALARTIDTGIAHYWSRSRRSLWKKGETSGNLQHIEEISVDCDQDAILLRVRVAGHDASCHTGRRSCFFRSLTRGEDGSLRLVTGQDQRFEPKAVYER
ncbi:phosphoribosyl-AMP cyclohydrolase [Pseudohoeflea coraliihabitans]|uniref:Phosphoribosyl-AMP cyclohydrolase n=1 Tax=Pseudohoeflea coraliihabitans TaxID=2860393 RepID=A0ABS6WS28_9HYPH|nr:phosphoribosyl-AMP cyclohydrolase [Pseudohoeflea sp. DP4N28-3]MBW3098217.1 phosphoribosyl-AMP cyclohydrolase [Pseudohoeflea sp. DP4N28-3]